jgi:hypothetical protein
MTVSLHGKVPSQVGTPLTWSVGFGIRKGPPLKVTGGPPTDRVAGGPGVGVGVGAAAAVVSVVKVPV